MPTKGFPQPDGPPCTALSSNCSNSISSKVFSMLSEDGYHLHDMEAVSFLPFLINKVGDPKDQIRNSIRSIFRILSNVYPASKFSGHLMEGIKSKNAKQRTGRQFNRNKVT